jgi:alkylation response protein AidB-like acyl-CoA dehydrogenase
MTLNVEASTRDGFADAAQAWLEEHVPTRWREARGGLTEEESNALRREWDRLLFEGGYAGLSLPKEFGGQGLGVAEEVIFADLAGRAQAPDGLARIGRILTAPTLVAHGTEAQLSKYLPKILSGEEIWCQGFSEPDAGSDLAGIKTKAVRVEGGYRISGRKIWTSFADMADRCLMLAQTDFEAPRHRNLTLFLLDMRQPGIDISPIRQSSGLSHFAEVTFTDVFVADEDRVAEEGSGWKVAMTVLANERGCVEAASRYIEMRADMDLLQQSLGADPGYHRQLEEFEAGVELVRWQVMKSIDFDPHSQEYFRSTSVLKVFWSELWQQMCELGLETANAETAEHWKFQYLESRSASIYSGTSEIQRNIISERVLGLPR